MTSLLPDTDSEDELPPGWEERVTLDGKVFYANHEDQATQWSHPKSGKKKKVPTEMPFGWEQRIEEDGTVIYVNEDAHKTTYTDPRLAFAMEDRDEPTPGCTGLRTGFRSTSMSSDPGFASSDRHGSSASSLGTLVTTKVTLDASTTALQVLHGRDLTGRVAIVTGGNCGIGYETARALAFHGCHVVIGCRDLTASRLAADRITAERPARARVTPLKLDLSNLRSIEDFVDQFHALALPLNILILNAATMGLPHRMTTDGFEYTFQVNHLGHFYLVQLLLEDLVRVQRSGSGSGPGPGPGPGTKRLLTSTGSGPSRVIVVSSESHRFSFLTRDNISVEYLSPGTGSGPESGPGPGPGPVGYRNFISMSAYNDSKLCNILFARQLAGRLRNFSVTVSAVHPGNMVSSNIARNWWIYRALYALVRPFTKSLEQGAATSVYAAIDHPDLTSVSISGAYLNNCRLTPPSGQALDDELARRLWTLSEEMLAGKTRPR